MWSKWQQTHQQLAQENLAHRMGESAHAGPRWENRQRCPRFDKHRKHNLWRSRESTSPTSTRALFMLREPRTVIKFYKMGSREKTECWKLFAVPNKGCAVDINEGRLFLLRTATLIKEQSRWPPPVRTARSKHQRTDNGSHAEAKTRNVLCLSTEWVSWHTISTRHSRKNAWRWRGV